MDSETIGAILLNDVDGTKYDGRAKSVLKKLFTSGSAPHSSVHVIRGELIFRTDFEDSPLNYELSRDSSICLFADGNDVAPLNREEFHLLEAIQRPFDRLAAFKNKLEFGVNLKEGCAVCVTLPGANISSPKRARAVVRYKGSMDSQPGIYFGVELFREKHRGNVDKIGTTDGTFRDKRYFDCHDGFGLFVPLHLVSPTDDGQSKSTHPVESSELASRRESKPNYSSSDNNRGSKSPTLKSSYSSVTKNGNRSHSQQKPSKPGKETSVDPAPSVFIIGQRVLFHSKQGIKHYGVVHWTGRETPYKTFEYPVVGIKTEEGLYLSDFEYSIQGISHLMKSIPSKLALFLPEGLVEESSNQKSESGPAQENTSSGEQLKKSPDKIPRQREAVEHGQKTKWSNVEAEQGGSDFTGHQRPEQREQQREKRDNFEGDRDWMKQKAHQYEYVDPSMMKHHERKYADQHRPIEQTPPDYQLPANYPNEVLGDGQCDLNPRHKNGGAVSQLKLGDHGDQAQKYHATSTYGPPYPLNTDSRWNIPEKSQDHGGDAIQGGQYGPTSGNETHHCEGGGSVPFNPADTATSQDQQVLATTCTSGNGVFNLTEGSLIQIPAPDPHHPMRYGTIRWIGILPNVIGRIAGIELDEAMEGCSDGTYPQTNRKFFSCPYGRGLYYPLENLQPDERYAPAEAADGNPLRHVSEEESTAPVTFTVQQYIGEEKGIQGHQNSCYLDATLFGLFALTSEFDAMFLQNAESKTTAIIGTILWKNIVNPLRKNGVVKYECVMRLREELDQLGRMKGLTQDEKDPEEFLNMMFKHTLLVPPFISIRRPFGVEKEFFVQLFLEMDEAQKSPSIGDLVDKMFAEQNISFTEIPSKLLIIVPRFGKKFQTFRKIIPAKSLNVAKSVDMKNPLECYNCQAIACKICHECTKGYGGDVPAFCDQCLAMVHQKKRRHHKWEWCDEMKEIRRLAEFELLSVICIETSHYVCFARQETRWIFFDSMANRVYDKYNIPKVVDCTDVLNEWVYPEDGKLTRLLNTPPRELPEYVRRFTQDIYMCVYIQPDVGMYR